MESENNLSGRYSSIHDFITMNKLERKAIEVLGEGWEADNDISQIEAIVGSGYSVSHNQKTTEREKREDDYISVVKIVNRTYKLWITIEEHIEMADGTDSYRDLKDEDTRSVGDYTTLEKAVEQMNSLGDMHVHDGDVENFF